jgi:hypothetical protein
VNSASRAAANRRSGPVRLYRLGSEPGDDLGASTTAEARVQNKRATGRARDKADLEALGEHA